MGAAYVLKLDDQIGAIKCGKWADFTELDQDPQTVYPYDLRSIRIYCTILGEKVKL
jgi:predicted amidohydrolase YtcJ